MSDRFASVAGKAQRLDGFEQVLNAALADLLTKLALYGIIVDGTSA